MQSQAPMIILAYIALIVVPIGAIVFLILAGATPRNVAAVIVLQWLFLPLIGLKLHEGIPTFDKASAVVVTVLAGVMISRPGVVLQFRPNWIDVPMMAWCLVPMVSSQDNNLGVYDGLSTAFRCVITWGVPYFAGRILSRDTSFLVALGKALLIGSVLYAPLILFESRFAPLLHLWIYGVRGRPNWEDVGFFGPLRWKPTVFLQTQLELTPLMGIGFLFGFWLWRAGKLNALGVIGMRWLVSIAAMSTILGKSLGGVSLTVAGGGVLLLTRRFRSIVFLLSLSLVAPLYIATRTLEWWSGQQIVDLLKQDISQRRAESFGTRLHNEDILLAKALEQPVWGWGGWGRARVYDKNGKDISITDGLWIIAFGDNGIVGLSALYLALLLPVWVLCLRPDRHRLWEDSRASVVLAAAVVVVLHSIDCLANAMPNPIYCLLAGGLASIAIQPVAAEVRSQRSEVRGGGFGFAHSDSLGVLR
jgi:hypothetical protein